MKNTMFKGDAMRVLLNHQYLIREANCLVTSPPYYRQRKYTDDPNEIGQEKTVEEYIKRISDVIIEFCCKQNFSAWIVIGDKRSKGTLDMVPQRLALELSNFFNIPEILIWEKANAMPAGNTAKSVFDPSHEYLIHATSKFGYYHNKLREPALTGSWDAMPAIGGKKKSGDNRYSGNRPACDGMRNMRSVWRMATARSLSKHSAPFPVPLAKRMIEASCPPGGTVIDPFCGTGATCIAANELGMNFIGIDICADHLQTKMEVFES